MRRKELDMSAALVMQIADVFFQYGACAVALWKGPDTSKIS